MSAFDTIVVENDFVSEHWLAEQFPATVRTRRAEWKEREDHTKITPRSGLISLAGDFGRDLVRYREAESQHREQLALREAKESLKDRARLNAQLSALHATIRAALLLPAEETTWVGARTGTEMTVQAAVPQSPTGTPLLLLQARDAAKIEDLLDTDGAGHLLTPAIVDGEPVSATSEVLSGLFHTEEKPALILVTAGAWLLLAERATWPEGRYLAIDLATALERRDTKASGEIETIAALVGAESLVPDTGEDKARLLSLLEDSVKHAEGVSKGLRDGVRESIELIASDVLRRRRDNGLPDDVDGLAADLTRQSLRYLYRILFLLYAEARPELGVLPVQAPEYAEGYGLDRLRELVLTDLTSATAQTGTHFYSSLGVLFRLVNDGYPPETLGPDGNRVPEPDDRGGLKFEALRADLFSPKATALIDEVGLGNACLQKVLGRLLLSKKQRGRDRGFVSYAQLGINQLGAVYEGLMSYTGSIARDYMVEVAKDGDPAKGSWVVPISSTEGFDDKWFVMRDDPDTGDRNRVEYEPGDFVFRLSGRDRQRSASYYTPEVLTRCVVTHSLAELLDQNETTTPAADILKLTVCEPALGSGAFLVEAINQLADQYLTRRQRELGEEIPPEKYAEEKQKVKAYLALHNCYGVDLNATAVELAEITLWLDAMHPGLRAPWFGLHLRRGNSLIGARRETYTPAQVAKKGWLKTVPTARPLSERVAATEIHHFLLPAAGWGAVADTKEAKELRPEETRALKEWRKQITSTLSKAEVQKFQDLGRRVEALWALANRRLEIAESEIRRDIAVWGATELPVGTGAVKREQIEESLSNPDSAYGRLRRVMDAWAALWYWPVANGETPPTREQWINALEGLLGHTSKAEIKKGRGLFADDATWAELDDAEHNERSFADMQPVEELLGQHPWLEISSRIAEREGLFHWELDFAPIFASGGGFDLQVGNPPWVRPEWDDTLTLAEADPWFGLTEKISVSTFDDRRRSTLALSTVRYLDERAAVAGTTSQLISSVERPILAGRPDLYRAFMDRCWRSMTPNAAVGLIHPESHFSETRAATLRRQTYERLRRHWQFRNELLLFEIHHTRQFGVQIYGPPREPRFLNASSLYHPDTLERSLRHKGEGDEPGIKDADDRWDTRPHSARIIEVDRTTLATWADLIDPPGTPALEARMLRPVTESSQRVLTKISGGSRLQHTGFNWTLGWMEAEARKDGFYVSESAVPETLDDAILQGPHLTVANPFAKQPNPSMRSNLDYTPWDLETLPKDAISRTSYQRAVDRAKFVAGLQHWDGQPANRFWRLAWRNMVDSSTVRSLHAALIPPGPTHVHGVYSLTTTPPELAIAAGMWASIPLDFLVKASGVSKVQAEFAARFPQPSGHPLVRELILRALRLNCLTADYAPLWEELFDEDWRLDRWTASGMPTPEVGEVEKSWTMATPLRRDQERRQALVEIDALAAVMLSITAEELCAIYRTQFGVLRKYERVMQFDANGRQVPKDVLKEYEKHGSRADLGRYELPFTSVDREKEMTEAHEQFSRRLQMRELKHEDFDTGDPALNEKILGLSRATGMSPGYLHRVYYGG
ncbi:restriction endonuclease subunit M [Pseudonocardia sp. RS11V-5]|uniref:Eco57I restriction-modification methylase domain-containing protein n=1 Tax=Pseudonocardia terrae TaxID=2905831 RepID=UPI001E455697|nr:restriction endonuclease subunit M [Pseudonocardia terrae]MCE3554514.1 restriction endonuclease subunit M [Pseudonocardia terrae]